MVAIAKSQMEPAVLSIGSVDSTKRRRLLKLLDIAVLIAAMIIFLVFLNLLVRIVFPQGSRLVDSTSIESTSLPVSSDRGLIDIAGDGVGNVRGFFAQLGAIRRDVKIRPANSIAWTTARQGTAVNDRDAVQTFSNSRARVDFTADNELRIGQNSLVVFSNGAADPFLSRREPAVVVMDGELAGSVNAEYGVFEVEFPAGLVELTADRRSGEDVNFRVGVNPDKSSTIAIYSGRADINVAGEHYTVSANEGLTIAKDGTTSGVAVLPSLPSIKRPNDNSIAGYLHIPPRVKFEWGNVSRALGYRLEIAQDARFEEILVDEKLESASFIHGNLAPGEYFWRVSALSGWVQGPVTTARRLRVVRDVQPPSLALQPIQQLTTEGYVLRGKTSKNAKIYVLGKPVNTMPDGHFEYLFNPQPGAQTIVVESVDAVGNVAYVSEVLHVPGTPGRSN